MEGLGYPQGIGEYVYLHDAWALYRAIAIAEGNPKNLGLLVGPQAAKPGETLEVLFGRLSNVVRTAYERWVAAGKPGEFLDYLAYGGPGYGGYAPLGAKNDPPTPKDKYGKNFNWLKNVLGSLPRWVRIGAVYDTPQAREAQRAIEEARIPQQTVLPSPPLKYRGR